MLTPENEVPVVNTDSAQTAIQQKLYEAFNEARGRNPHISLRAFARRLAVSPAALSEILRGKRRITGNRAKELISRMGLDPAEASRILDLFAKEPRPYGRRTEQNPESSMSMQRLTDQFNIAAEWYHFAIISLAQTMDFNSDPKIIAERLNINEKIAKTAIERLLRVGLLIVEAEKIKLNPDMASINGAIPADIVQAALRKAQTQNLDLARRALDEENIDAHEFVSINVAMSPDRVAQARSEIASFLQQLAGKLEVAPLTEVYKLNVQLFQLSHKRPTAEAAAPSALENA